MQRLERGRYEIPEGCICVKVIGENAVEVRDKKERKRLGPDDRRCCNCLHFTEGKITAAQWWDGTICDAKPKNIAKGTYYATTYRSGQNCELFKKREDDKD